MLPDDLGAIFTDKSRTMPRARLGSGSWQLEDDALARLRDKIAGGKKTLAEVYGVPLYGIKTGLNEAFIIDTPTRDRLVRQDKKSAELLNPFLKGENVKRWSVESEGLFLINTPRGKVDIGKYPAVRDWLLPFKTDLEMRATKQEWWELQQAQLAYQPKFESSKIVYLDIANGPPFALDPSGALIDCTVFAVAGTDEWLLPYLNSRVAWLQLIGETPIARGGYVRLKQQYISPIALPDGSNVKLSSLANVGRKIFELSASSFSLRGLTHHRILEDLAPVERKKLTTKLQNFWTLDFAAFRAEVKRAFKVEIPVKDRDDWERYLAAKSTEVIKLTAEIKAAEREIDAIVYKLFDLTPDEIKLLEDSLEGRY